VAGQSLSTMNALPSAVLLASKLGFDSVPGTRSYPEKSKNKNEQKLTSHVQGSSKTRPNSVSRRTNYASSPLNIQACRDFIVLELGEEEHLPRLLPYKAGIQEVRSRLISRYGDEKIGQTMHIVYDLIENKKNAMGLGDEGDIWAPWYVKEPSTGFAKAHQWSQ